MAITIDAVTLQPVKVAQPSIAPITVAPQVVVADSARGSRRDSKNDRGGKEQSLNFRAVLDAVASGSIKLEAVQTEAGKADVSPRPTRVPKTGPSELNGSEAPVMLEAAYVRRGSDNGARIHLAATSRYAQAFFADTRTFARPGESLEMTV